MSKRNEPCKCGSGKKYKNCCQRRVTSSTINYDRLTTVATYSGMADVYGEVLPVFIPVGDIPDQMDFDRTMCECGVRTFARPWHVSDWPQNEDVRAKMKQTSHVVVSEISPGMRSRRGVDLFTAPAE